MDRLAEIKKYNTAFSFLLVLIIVSMFRPGQALAEGECALDFLNLPAGAYSASLGQGDYAGIVGPEAIFGNPSLMGSKSGGFVSHHELLLDTRSEAVAATARLGTRFSLGAGIYVFDPGEISGYSTENTATGTVSAGDRMVRLALASHGVMSYGFSVSYYNQRLDDRVGQGFGIGGGVSLDKSFGRLALTADNIGPDFKIAGSSAPLPQRYSLSAWLPFHGDLLTLSADMGYDRNSGFQGAVGVEYRLLNGFNLRAGTNNDNPLSLGMRVSSKKLAIDYSYVPLGLFGDRHIFSVSYLY